MRRALAALALAVALIQPLPGLAAGQHVVKSGETLSEIAERYGVSVQKLMELNGIKDADLVEAGTKLKLPDGATAKTGGGGSGSTDRASHTVSSGETLSEIAERYSISVPKLMELNGLEDADLVQVGQRLKVPGAKTGRVHVVQSGETLTQIAERYKVPLARLVSLNKLDSPDALQAGIKLSLGPDNGTPPAKPVAAKPAPAGPAKAKPAPAERDPAPQAAAPKPAAQPAPKPAPNPPSQDDLPATENAEAEVEPTPAAQPTPTAAPGPAEAPTPAAATPPAAKPKPAAVAAAKPRPDPSNTAPPDWRTYGPLQVDFSNWRPMGGSQVAPALNSTGQPVFVAINCAAGKINATGEAGAWSSWEDPGSDYEEKLIKDICKLTAG